MKLDYSLLVLRSHVSRVYLVFTGGILFPAKNLLTDLAQIFLPDPFSLIFCGLAANTASSNVRIYRWPWFPKGGKSKSVMRKGEVSSVLKA